MLNYLLCQLTAVQADGFGQVTKLLCGGTHGALRHNAQLLAVPAYCCASCWGYACCACGVLWNL